MFRWLTQMRDRLRKRRGERRAPAGERALRQNEAEALKYTSERLHDPNKGPMSGPGI